jgi:hypothetical protein
VSGHTTSGVTAINNVISRSTYNGLVIGPSVATAGRTVDSLFANNLLFLNGYRSTTVPADNAYVEIAYQFAARNTLVNNIIYASNDGNPSYLNVLPPNSAQLTLRNNLWYCDTGNQTGTYGWNPGTCCTSRTQLQSSTGQDAGGLFANPQFLSSADLQIVATSPARDAGLDHPSLLGASVTDRSGLPRKQGSSIDIGPAEYWPFYFWFREKFPADAFMSASRRLSDSDGDGAADIVEYAAGSDPLNRVDTPRLGINRTPGDFVTLNMRRSVTATDAAFALHAGTDLVGWTLTTSPGPTAGVDGTGLPQWRWAVPILGGNRRYFRLAADLVP